ncbi:MULTISPECIES: FAD binding domain-containing protein [unclassified Streptomyces]|uniref:FAD binding domain-containing protein n=1 Tax=unclassified Streptomyces TaxID=2593676 RepID=UPI000DC76409|nr:MULTISPECIES: FAD binding domain-containing protein [unclassified Streptomyces]AWZ04315.1 oxidoreductase [Streptomyces sp. ICC4]AWZ12425.1 oxidoreductase [Streptomyces sp. ICC1]
MSTEPTLADLSAAVLARGGELRAGGTDTTARQRGAISPGPFTDLDGADGLHGFTPLPGGGLRVGALTTLATLATDPRVRSGWPALALSAGTAATPQVRAAGTLSGNLLQRNRCWYYRNPHFSCLQKGGSGCPAREGDHHFGVVAGDGPCVAPHPSTLAMALLTYDAEVEVHGESPRTVADLYGDGDRLHRADHLLAPDRILTAVLLPPSLPGERAACHRATSRAHAEWPLVEATARLVLDGATVTHAAVAAGGVARVPLRLTEVEAVLIGREATPEVLAAAAATVLGRCRPLPQTAYKTTLFRDTVLEVLERAAAPAPTG